MPIFNGNSEIGQLRIGSQNFKEAWVGSNKVYSSGWDGVPANGIISQGGTAYVTTRNWVARSSYLEASGSGILDCFFDGVVFAPTTTTLTIEVTTTGYKPSSVYIDGVEQTVNWVGAVGTIAIDSPSNATHTIEMHHTQIKAIRLTKCWFNV